MYGLVLQLAELVRHLQHAAVDVLVRRRVRIERRRSSYLLRICTSSPPMRALPLDAVADEDRPSRRSRRSSGPSYLPKTRWMLRQLLVALVVVEAEDLDDLFHDARAAAPAVVLGRVLRRPCPAYALMFVPSKYLSTCTRPTWKPFARDFASSSETSPSSRICVEGHRAEAALVGEADVLDARADRCR